MTQHQHTTAARRTVLGTSVSRFDAVAIRAPSLVEPRRVMGVHDSVVATEIGAIG